MKYVALLRGINVGGNSRISMAELKKLCETLGFKEVKTYINSGNVLFEDMRSKKELAKILANEISRKFGFEVPIFLIDATTIARLCSKVPNEWSNDNNQKTDVIFLHEVVDSPEIINKVVHNNEIENVLYVKGAMVWNVARENVTRGNGIKLIKSNLYKFMTVRNINTVRKLNDLLDQ